MEKWSFQRIRELMTHIALRGMAANELGRARISMMVRSISSNTRPDTLVQDRTLQLGFSLATHGGSIRRVDTAPAVAACPLRPSKRTSTDATACPLCAKERTRLRGSALRARAEPGAPME